MSEVDAKPPQENPLTNILVNVIIPVLALSYLSKDPAIQELLGKETKFFHLGPVKAIVIALAFPICYGVWFFVRHKKLNFFSIVGLGSVLLTGGLTLYLWNKDGTIKENAAQLFGLKEASIPLILGVAIFFSHWTKSPLLNIFLYTDQIFDLKRIRKAVKEKDAEKDYGKLLFNCTIIFAGSFLISTVANYYLAQYFLGGIDTQANDAMTQYNVALGKLTGWGFLVIGVPILVFLIVLFFYLVRGLRKITGLETDDILPR